MTNMLGAGGGKNLSHLERPDGYSSCHDDRCTLITNIPPLEPTVKVDGFALTQKLQTLLERDLPGPNCEVFRAHQYHFAVDGNLDTQWVSTWTNASVGDYFGLDMLVLKKDLKNITLTVAHPFQQQLQLEVSMRGNSWYPINCQPVGKLRGSWKGMAVTSFTYDVSEAMLQSWKQAFGKLKRDILKNDDKGRRGALAKVGSAVQVSSLNAELLPPLYVRFLRFRAKRDYAAPLIVFELNYATGNRADNDVDDEEEDEASSAVIQPLPARPPAPGPPAPAGGLARWRVGGSSPSTVPVRRGGGGGVGSGREVLQAAGGRALQVAPGAGKTVKQQQYPAPHPHATLGSQVGGASSQARQGDAWTQMD